MEFKNDKEFLESLNVYQYQYLMEYEDRLRKRIVTEPALIKFYKKKYTVVEI